MCAYVRGNNIGTTTKEKKTLNYVTQGEKADVQESRSGYQLKNVQLSMQNKTNT